MPTKKTSIEPAPKTAATAKAVARPAASKVLAVNPAITATAVLSKPAAPTAPSQPSPGEVQFKAYESAVRLFSAGKLVDALASFQQAASGPAATIADKARTYAEVCRRRTAGTEVNLVSAEDHFNYGVARLNARAVGEARQHFSRALSLKPNADHVLYTMALCCGLEGDTDGACANLKRAIDIDPRNRILARQDPEFLALAAQIPGLRALLSPEYAY